MKRAKTKSESKGPKERGEAAAVAKAAPSSPLPEPSSASEATQSAPVLSEAAPRVAPATEVAAIACEAPAQLAKTLIMEAPFALPVAEPETTARPADASVGAAPEEQTLAERALRVIAGGASETVRHALEGDRLRAEARALLERAAAEAARLRDEADRERRDARDEAARLHDELSAIRLEAQRQAEEVRASAERYERDAEERLERARLELQAETERAHAAMEREMARMREEALADAVHERDRLLGDPRDAIERAEAELADALARLATASTSLTARAGDEPPTARDPARETARDKALRAGTAAGFDHPAAPLLVDALPHARAAAPSTATAALAAGGDALTDLHAIAPTARRGAGALSALSVAALFGVAALLAIELRQLSALRDTVDAQGQVLASLAARSDRDRAAPPPAATAPTTAVAGPTPTGTPAAPPAAAPAVAAVAAPTVPPTAPAAAAEPAPPPPRDAARATGPLTAAESASIDALLDGRNVPSWRKRRILFAARRARKADGIEQAELDKLTAALEKRDLGPVTREELDDMRKISRAQTTLVACRLLEEKMADRQLGSLTVQALRDVAAGTLACKSAKPEDAAALAMLAKDVASPDWRDFLDEARAARIARAALAE